MISSKVLEAFNNQINAEFWSAYLYLSMSADFSSKGLDGFAHWFTVQFSEENSHALKFFEYINDRGGHVSLKPIAAVPHTWATPVDAFEEVVKHEQKVTQLINGIMDVAVEEKDYASQSFLKWFIDEQVEEEHIAATILEKLKRVGDRGGLLYLDKELKKRT